MSQNLSRDNNWLNPAFLYYLALGVILIAFTSILAKGFFFTSEYLHFRYDDDFYYYIGIAKNLSQDFQSTFNGTHISNGYHPLWMIILTGMLKIWDYESTGFHLVLTLIIIASFVISLRLTDRIFSLFDIPYWVRIAFIAVFFYASRLLYFGGMEVILTIPIGLFLLTYYLEKESPNFVLLGLLSSLLILSRLDSIFLVLFLLVQIIFTFQFSIKKLIRPLSLFALGGIALPIYLASNLYFFDSLLPLSGMAKQMKEVAGISLRPFIDWFTSEHPYKIILFITWVGEIVALGVLLSRYKQLSKRYKKLIPFIGFSVAFFIIHSILSDWNWWPWYLYPVLISAPIFTVFVVDVYRENWTFGKNLSGTLLAKLSVVPAFLIFAFALYQFTTPTRITRSYKELVEVSNFLNQQEGLNIAMGDAAGVMGLLLDESNTLIHLEGLVMDKDYLDLLASNPTQEEVFSKYEVDYYIMMEPKVSENDCRKSFFPKQAGETSIRIPTEQCVEAVFQEDRFFVFEYPSEIEESLTQTESEMPQ